MELWEWVCKNMKLLERVLRGQVARLLLREGVQLAEAWKKSRVERRQNTKYAVLLLCMSSTQKPHCNNAPGKGSTLHSNVETTESFKGTDSESTAFRCCVVKLQCCLEAHPLACTALSGLQKLHFCCFDRATNRMLWCNEKSWVLRAKNLEEVQ